jgi:hypothetical protein
MTVAKGPDLTPGGGDGLIRSVRLRARVLHDGEIRASLELEFESAWECRLRQLMRGLAMLAKHQLSKH